MDKVKLKPPMIVFQKSSSSTAFRRIVNHIAGAYPQDHQFILREVHMFCIS